MKCSETDEVLVLKANSGDSVAMKELVQRYSSAAQSKAARYTNLSATLDIDDLLQEALLGFISAVYTYKAGRQASFATYANVCMDNRLCNVAAAAKKKRNIPQSALVSLDDVAETQDGSLDVESAVIADEQSQSILSLFGTNLSDFEQSVFKLYLGGMGYADIAAKLNQPPKAVDNAIQRAKKKLRTALSEAGLNQ